MTELSFGSIEEFCEVVDDIISCSENKVTDVVAKYDEAKEIVKELIYYGYELEFVELEPIEWNGYDKEYSISVYDGKISCEKLWHEDRYYKSDADNVFFMDDVNSKVIKSYSDEAFMYEVSIKDEEDFLGCDGNCEDCELNEETRISYEDPEVKIDEDEDGIHGFTVSKSDGETCSSYSFYSSDSIDGMTLKHIFKIFGI